MSQLHNYNILESFKNRGKDFNELRKQLAEVTSNHEVYNWKKLEEDNKSLIYWAIKLGLLQPVKGVQTYQAAFSALYLPFRPVKSRV